MKVAFHTFGCKLNQVETEAIAEMFAAEGFQISDEREADIFFVNTCAVTHRAEAKSRRLLRRLGREHPGKVIAAGCLAQLKPQKVDGFADIKLILGTKERMQVVEILREYNHQKIYVSSNPVGEFFHSGGNRFHSRSFIKIQDGCDRHCSYCIVPELRGPSVSLPLSLVLQQVKKALEHIPREIVLTGVDIGSFRDCDGAILADLLVELVKLPELVRLRLSSVEPPGFTSDLVEICAASEKICPHFHLPLQSGSNKILRKMNRGYTAEEYLELASSLADKIDGIRIGADVIVGFPGETESDFKRTIDLIEKSPITHLHIFPFSPRPGTGFSEQDDTVHPVVKSERARCLKTLIAERNRRFHQNSLGKVKTVFFEENGSKGGFTDNYIRVFLPGEALTGFHPIRLKSLHPDRNGVIGEIIK
ncbi:MAG: tRNA (N(6)-L-threonylcarbamoyladenosine(37)-C(2))-methylthiotransferase MtaB [candidate division Zixibacteria bacterium]|nr:tRNA (N(6)-L-threonylcarbamoyladenosine(37)-C(2))-methylthiotransferase MtaB [Candidatus Tariuqbacter arcticus]